MQEYGGTYEADSLVSFSPGAHVFSCDGNAQDGVREGAQGIGGNVLGRSLQGLGRFPTACNGSD